MGGTKRDERQGKAAALLKHVVIGVGRGDILHWCGLERYVSHVRIMNIMCMGR